MRRWPGGDAILGSEGPEAPVLGTLHLPAATVLQKLAGTCAARIQIN